MTTFLNLWRTELFLMRKRSATWIVGAIWMAIVCVFPYLLPYILYRTGSSAFDDSLDILLPGYLTQTVGEGLPFYGGAWALILGVLTLGSDFGWNTWKTLFTQRPGRMPIFFAKIGALGVATLAMVVGAFGMGAICSTIIALIEDAPISFPAVTSLLESTVTGWLIFSVWAMAGVALAVITRGTSLAIGIGILWGLALEGILSAFIVQIDGLSRIADIMMRANGYSLIRAINDGDILTTGGPGAFSGPYVSGTQAFATLAVYLVVFVGLSAWLLRRRDIA